MYVDLCVRPNNVDNLKAIMNLALRFNYKAIAIDMLSGNVSSTNELTIIRRYTYTSPSAVGKVRESISNTLLVYELSESSTIRALDRLRGKFHMLKLTSKALANLKRSHMRKLRNCGIPIEVVFNDVVVNGRVDPGFLRGFTKIVPYIESGDVDLIFSSGARDYLELLHPIVAVALLKELGLSYLTSLKALTTSPRRVLEVITS